MLMSKGDFNKQKQISKNPTIDLPEDVQGYHNNYQQSQGEYQYNQQQHDDDHQQQQQQGQEVNYNQNMNKSVQNSQQVDRLKQQLIILYQSRVFNKILSKLQQRTFWLKFNTFLSIKSIYSSKPIYSHQQKINILVNKIQSIVHKNNNTMKIKSLVFNKIKQIEHNRKYTNQLKTSFFIKYFINPTYSKLAYAFSLIKKSNNLNTLSSNNLNSNNKISQKSTTNQTSTKLNDKMLIKYQKQSRKFRIKQITVTLRNFINKKYLKPTLNIIKLYTHYKSYLLNQQKPIQNENNPTNNQLNHVKDARFIKKKVLPHKIIQDISTKKTYIDSNTLTLENINLGNYQIQTIKRKQFQSLHLFTVVIEKKIMNLYKFGFYTLLDTYLNVQNKIQQKNQNIKRQQNPIKRVDKDSQAIIMRNVMKNMCYISSKISKKRQKKMITQRHQLSIKIMSSILHKSIRNLSSIGFYTIKHEIAKENMLILQRIRQLQQVKRECLQYFNNSIMDDDDECMRDN